MATSYGSITIVDITDVGEFSVYPKANSPRVQIYDPNTSTYTPNWAGTGTSLVIEPVAYYAGTNVSSAATFTWKRREGIGNAVDLITGETAAADGSVTINQNMLASSASGIITYIVTANYTVDGIPLQAVGEIEFSLTKQGNITKTAKITGENIFKYDTSGAPVPTPAGGGNPTITLTGTVNNVSINAWQYKNAQGGWTTYPNSTTGATLTVTDQDASFINDKAIIKLATSDNSVYDLFTITKLRDGAAGQTVISAVLSNEDQMIPADKNGNPISFTGATTTLTIYEGSTDVTSLWTITKTLDHVTDNETYTNKATITAMSADVGSVTFSCSRANYSPITRTFNLVKVKTGADGQSPTIYSIEVNAVAVNKTIGGAYTPTSIVAHAWSQTGTSKTAYSGRIQFYLDDSSTPYAISDGYASQDTNTRTLDLTGISSVSKIRVVLYQAGSTTTQLDAQTVVVTSDGATGQNGQPGAPGVAATTLVLGNEADVIPCTSANHPVPNGTGTDSDKFLITIPFEGYQGITKKSTTATSVPNLSSSTWGTSSDITPVITQATTGIGSIVYKIPNTATVPESGSINLGFTIAATEGNVVVNKVYTWTRSSAATNGKNAVILQVLSEDGTIFSNNSGTLTAKGLVFEGATQVSISDVTWHWYKYTNGSYAEISTTSSSADAYKNANGDTLTVKAGAVDGYASFKVTGTYPKTGAGATTYSQYISFIDKSDPIQISVHSTVGLQIKNGQGAGAIYARVTRNGVDIDYVPLNVQAGATYPSSPVANQYFVKLNGSGTSGTATLVKYDGSAWVGVTQTCTYEWTYRDENNNVLSSNTPSLTGQFVYIDKDLIDGKITADVKVTVPN